MLGALGYSLEQDSLRQRLEDSEEALKQHVKMAADLAAEVEHREARIGHLEAELKHLRFQDRKTRVGPQTLEEQELPTCSEMALHVHGDEEATQHDDDYSQPQARHHAAIVRSFHGRADRALVRSVIQSWRAYYEKAQMLSNMRDLIGKAPPMETPPSPPGAPVDETASPSTSHVQLATGLSAVASSSSASEARIPKRTMSRDVCLLRWRLAASEIMRRNRQPMKIAQSTVQGVGGAPQAASAVGLASARPAESAQSTTIPTPANTPALPQRLLSWLTPSGSDDANGSWRLSASTEAYTCRLQHLTTENHFLRERIEMVEASVQPLLEEVSDKRESPHYFLCSTVNGRMPSLPCIPFLDSR